MTGFGTGESSNSEVRLTVELVGVNRKQTDIVVNFPRYLSELESGIRKTIASAVSRGRITASIKVERMGASTSTLEVDEDLAAQYLDAMERISKTRGIASTASPVELLRAPGVFNVRDSELDLDEAESLLNAALVAALEQFRITQETEGAAMKADLVARVELLRASAKHIEKLSPKVKEHFRNQLHRRLNESDIEISFEDERFVKEIGIFAEKSDISEEITRLGSHFEQFERYFNGSEPCGRPLDFLCQEVNREFNTIGSKANDAGIAQLVVDAKTEVEKIREQVQNVQ